MIRYLLNIYSIAFITIYAAVLGIIWGLCKTYSINIQNRLNTFLVHCLIAFVIAFPCAWIVGNYNHLKDKLQLINKVMEIRNDIISKKRGELETIPIRNRVPWQMLIEKDDNDILISNIRQVSLEIKQLFTPETSEIFDDLLDVIDRSHVATFKVPEGKPGLALYHSYLCKEYQFIVENSLFVIDKMRAETSTRFIPMPQFYSLNYLGKLIGDSGEAIRYPDWIITARVANILVKKYPSEFFSKIVLGISLCLTAREERGVIFIEDALKNIPSEKSYFGWRELDSFGCALLYKYYYYRGSYYIPRDINKADHYKELGLKLNADMFNRYLENVKKDGMDDPDWPVIIYRHNMEHKTNKKSREK